MKDEGGRVKDETQKAKITPYVLRSTIVLSALLVAALPGMYPPLWNADFGDTSPRGMIDFELSGVALGTTSTGDFLPAAVGRVPPPTSSLLDSYSPSSGLVDKFDHSTLPQGATLRVEEHTARLDRFHVDAPVEFTARVLTFYFPGWQVTIDGTPAPIKPTNQSGFISFSVPAGDHTVEVSLDLTTPRRVGTIISLAALLALAALAVRPAQHTLRITPQASPIFAAQKREFVSGFSSFVICAMFLAADVLVFDPGDPRFRYPSPAGEVHGEQHRQMANFGGHIELLGYDLPTTSVEPGQAIPLTLYWKATAPVPTNYQVFVQLTRPATTLWGQSDKLNPGDFPSTRWPLDKYVWDDHTLRVLPGTPPGEYRISIGLYTLADGRRAPVFDAQGNVAGDHVLLDTPIVVQRPGVSPDLDALQMQGRLDRDYNGARLLGWSVEEAQISTPNFARLTLFWRAEADRLPNLRTRAELIDPAGKPAQTIEAYPVQDAYPMTGWARGEIVRDQIAFWLPPDFPPDPYALRVSILAENGTILDTLDLTHIEVK